MVTKEEVQLLWQKLQALEQRFESQQQNQSAPPEPASALSLADLMETYTQLKKKLLTKLKELIQAEATSKASSDEKNKLDAANKFLNTTKKSVSERLVTMQQNMEQYYTTLQNSASHYSYYIQLFLFYEGVFEVIDDILIGGVIFNLLEKTSPLNANITALGLGGLKIGMLVGVYFYTNWLNDASKEISQYVLTTAEENQAKELSGYVQYQPPEPSDSKTDVAYDGPVLSQNATLAQVKDACAELEKRINEAEIKSSTLPTENSKLYTDLAMLIKEEKDLASNATDIAKTLLDMNSNIKQYESKLNANVNQQLLNSYPLLATALLTTAFCTLLKAVLALLLLHKKLSLHNIRRNTILFALPTTGVLASGGAFCYWLYSNSSIRNQFNMQNSYYHKVAKLTEYDSAKNRDYNPKQQTSAAAPPGVSNLLSNFPTMPQWQPR